LHIKKREIGKDKTIIKVGSRVYVDMEMGCKYLTKKRNPWKEDIQRAKNMFMG